MHFFSGLSIKWKLLLIIMLCNSSALVMTGIAFAAYDRLEQYLSIGALFFVAACLVAGLVAVLLQRLLLTS